MPSAYCIRCAYLCGEDGYTKQSFEHRRQWMVDRTRFLTYVFAINVAAYDVMSNQDKDREIKIGDKDRDTQQLISLIDSLFITGKMLLFTLN